MSTEIDDLFNIPEYLRAGLVKKFTELTSDKSKISKVPGMLENVCMVSSSTNPRQPHFVDATAKNGKVACDCICYKTHKLCAHCLAGAKFLGVLQRFADWHKKQTPSTRLDAIVEHNLQKGVGQKKSKKTEQRMGTSTPNPPIRRIATASSSLSMVAVPSAGNCRNPSVQPSPYTVELHYLHSCHHKVKTCYGCHKDLRYADADAFSPLDLIAVSNVQRMYFDANEKKEKEGECD